MVETADKLDSCPKIQSMVPKSVPSIHFLRFPFTLKKDQLAAVESWVSNGFRGTILYSTGTGKTEIAFECAKRLMGAYPHFFKSGGDSGNDLLYEADHDTKSSQIDGQRKLNLVETLKSEKEINTNYSFFNILILVPRISLIDQTIKRLISYGIPEDKVGSYFGERKEKREIIVSTYNSVVRNPILIRRSTMIILDEVHLIKDTSKSFVKVFDYLIEDPKKGVLGLTATLDEKDQKNSTIMAVIPPIIKYPIKMAVKDNRLAKPIIIPVKVSLTDEERTEYDKFTTKIKNISNRFKRYDVESMTNLLRKGGFASGMAKAWFSNIRKRKLLLSYADNKLSAACHIIEYKFPDEKIMVFSETIESIQKLKQILLERGIESQIIDAKVRSSERQRILNNWGTTFNVLLSVHTLEIGYDVPQVRIEIILATTSNINQIVQRIGRVLRKFEGKSIALIYVVYIPDTKDDNVIDIVAKAISPKEELNSNSKPPLKQQENLERNSSDENSVDRNMISKDEPTMGKDKSIFLSPKKKYDNDILNKKVIKLIKQKGNEDDRVRRINRAFQIVEHSLKEKSLITEQVDNSPSVKDGNLHKYHRSELNLKNETRIYKVKSTSDNNKTYVVDLEKLSCTCADYLFRNSKCKHIFATEFASVEK
ncbi:MAG TPA: DEAD/DEAH box helicase [Candidatus Nitrosocosmicus sp.]|nr:DEAD/DEAH box helicase [Candidatus Nitrosocosmicus sp.]